MASGKVGCSVGDNDLVIHKEENDASIQTQHNTRVSQHNNAANAPCSPTPLYGQDKSLSAASTLTTTDVTEAYETVHMNIPSPADILNETCPYTLAFTRDPRLALSLIYLPILSPERGWIAVSGEALLYDIRAQVAEGVSLYRVRCRASARVLGTGTPLPSVELTREIWLYRLLRNTGLAVEFFRVFSAPADLLAWRTDLKAIRDDPEVWQCVLNLYFDLVWNAAGGMKSQTFR